MGPMGDRVNKTVDNAVLRKTNKTWNAFNDYTAILLVLIAQKIEAARRGPNYSTGLMNNLCVYLFDDVIYFYMSFYLSHWGNPP